MIEAKAIALSFMIFLFAEDSTEDSRAPAWIKQAQNFNHAGGRTAPKGPTITRTRLNFTRDRQAASDEFAAFPPAPTATSRYELFAAVFVWRVSGDANSCSMSARKVSVSVAPLMKRPLMTKLGVPVRPSFLPSASVLATAGA